MTSSTKLCCISVESDSLASDNHTATEGGREGGRVLNLCISCAWVFIQVGMEAGRKEEEGCKVPIQI